MPHLRPPLPVAGFVRIAGSFAVALGLTLSFAPSTARGQTAGADVVSRRLLDAILTTDLRMAMGSGGPELQIGSAPPLVAAEIDLPSGSEILGSLVYGQATDLLAVIALPADSSRSAIERSLVAKGWRRPPYPQRLTGGLMYGPIDLSPTRMMCKGSDAYVTVSTSARPASPRPSTFVRISFQNGDSQCNMQERVFSSTNYTNPFAAVPPLFPPTGASMARCSQANNGMSSMGQTYSSALEPRELLAHYARQFEAAGWKSSTLPDVRFGAWSAVDSTGKKREASLMIATAPGQQGCYTLSLSVTRN